MISCYNNFDSPTHDDREGTSNYSIKSLHTHLADKEYSDITNDLTIQGVVTANDKSNNIYNSMFIQHNGYAVEVLIKLSNSHVKFPEGHRVFINLKGLRVDRSYGVVQIGLPAANMGEIEQISGMMVIDKHITVTAKNDKAIPEVVTLKQLKSADNLDNYYGRLIELHHMTHLPDLYLNPNNLWSGSNTFEQHDAELESGDYHDTDIYVQFLKLLAHLYP